MVGEKIIKCFIERFICYILVFVLVCDKFKGKNLNLFFSRGRIDKGI